MKMESIDYVKVTDRANYVPGKSSTGGCYLFTQTYRKVEEGYEVEYGTSAEFDYCPINGTFQSCNSCSDRCSDENLLERHGCLAEREIISSEELEKIISNAHQADEMEVVIQ